MRNIRKNIIIKMPNEKTTVIDIPIQHTLFNLVEGLVEKRTVLPAESRNRNSSSTIIMIGERGFMSGADHLR